MLLVAIIKAFVESQLTCTIETAWEARVFTQFICLLAARARMWLPFEPIAFQILCDFLKTKS